MTRISGGSCTCISLGIPRGHTGSASGHFHQPALVVSIGLPGSREGPWPESRAFFLALVPEFNQIVERVRPAVDRVFREWLDRPLSRDVWQDVKLAGFGVDDPRRDACAMGCGL